MLQNSIIHSFIGEKTFGKAKKLETVKKSLIKNQTEFSEIKQSIKINQSLLITKPIQGFEGREPGFQFKERKILNKLI